MTLPSSLNRWCNCKKSWSSERPKWKEWEFGSITAQPRSWNLGRGDVLHKFGKEPCGMCLKCTNAVFCGGCPSCLHKKSSGISSPLKPYYSFRYKRRTGQARSKDSRIMTWVTVSGEKLGVVPSIWGNLGTLGTAYSQMAVVNSLLSQDAVSHGVHSTSPAHPHLLLVPHHLQRKSLPLVCQECHASYKRNMGPKLLGLAPPATQWPNNDSLDARCHSQWPIQLAEYVGEDAAWWSGKGTPHSQTQMACHVEPSDGWL